jgi:hypothetical protein
MAHRPPGHTSLCELDRTELSRRAREQLARISAFLYIIVRRPEVQTRAILAGYSQSTPHGGAYLAEWLAGQRPFLEWREWRALRPPSDPELPELVSELDAWRVRWQPRALAAASDLEDPDDRVELESLLGERNQDCCLTLRARRYAQAIELLAKTPVDGYQTTWRRLTEQGIQAELKRFHRALKTVEDYIRNAPLEASEVADIHDARERKADLIAEWLSERRTELEGRLSEETMVLLALRDAAPPPLPNVRIRVLFDFSPQAKA